MNTPNKKIAVFDIDGTLFRWQLFHELVFELSSRNILDRKTSSDIEKQFLSWRALTGTWRDYEDKVIAALLANIETIHPGDLSKAAEAVIKRSGHKVYNYTSTLARQLKKEGYFLLAITGSQQEIAEPFTKKHGFDKCIGLLHSRDQTTGLFTKQYDRYVIGNKAKILTEFIADNGFNTKDSYAIGDSEGDSQILEIAENPIAFNPDEGLLKIALDKKWPVVIERKNIAYNLVAKPGGNYQLDNFEIF
jgi:HAD superfamily phosphoserine phosphatase-like hydrolase